jgi:hypothetical protein
MTAEEGALALAWDCARRPRNQMALGWYAAISLKNKRINCGKEL